MQHTMLVHHHSESTALYRTLKQTCGQTESKFLALTPQSYFIRPNNMAFHNLCQNATLPPGIANLLGLGLKYCLEAPLPRSQLTGLQQSLTRFERTVRIRHLIPA